MNRTIKFVKWIGLALTIVVLAWALLLPKVGLLDRLVLVAKVGALFGSLYGYLKWKAEKKRSGLSDDDFTLHQAGGPEGLHKQASDSRKVAIFFASLPFAAFLYGAIGETGSFKTGLTLLAILSIICIPFAALMHSQSRKHQALASKQTNGRIP